MASIEPIIGVPLPTTRILSSPSASRLRPRSSAPTRSNTDAPPMPQVVSRLPSEAKRKEIMSTVPLAATRP